MGAEEIAGGIKRYGALFLGWNGATSGEFGTFW